jgi:hypothetical protein
MFMNVYDIVAPVSIMEYLAGLIEKIGYRDLYKSDFFW